MLLRIFRNGRNVASISKICDGERESIIVDMNPRHASWYAATGLARYESRRVLLPVEVVK